jgi:hypothetical protein
MEIAKMGLPHAHKAKRHALPGPDPLVRSQMAGSVETATAGARYPSTWLSPFVEASVSFFPAAHHDLCRLT